MSPNGMEALPGIVREFVLKKRAMPGSGEEARKQFV